MLYLTFELNTLPEKLFVVPQERYVDSHS